MERGVSSTRAVILAQYDSPCRRQGAGREPKDLRERAGLLPAQNASSSLMERGSASRQPTPRSAWRTIRAERHGGTLLEDRSREPRDGLPGLWAVLSWLDGDQPARSAWRTR